MDATPNSADSAGATGMIDPAALEIILARHPKVLEAVVVGRSDAEHGQAWVAFVVPKHGMAPSAALRDELLQSLADQAGPANRVKELRFADALPKTRSGKILRRNVQAMASGTTDRLD